MSSITYKYSLDIIKQNKSDIQFFKHVVTAYNKNDEIAFFKIDGFGKKSPFDSNKTNDMTIEVTDETFKGKGISRQLFKVMFENIEQLFPDLKKKQNQLFYIDADASDGFWKSIGMEENETYETDDDDAEGNGYELKITYKKIKQWIHKKKTQTRERAAVKVKSTRKRTRKRSKSKSLD